MHEWCTANASIHPWVESILTMIQLWGVFKYAYGDIKVDYRIRQIVPPKEKKECICWLVWAFRQTKRRSCTDLHRKRWYSASKLAIGAMDNWLQL